MNKRLVKPYGDKLDDGMVQMSFSLPLPLGLAAEAAKELGLKMGLGDPKTVFTHDLGDGFTFVIVYGKCAHAVDRNALRPDTAVEESLDMNAVNALIKKKFNRRIVVVGACIESDAHTVGIDAILNMKGFHGNYGLERYSMFSVYNMGAQVPAEEMLKKARETNADALLVSQVVTQQNLHLHNLTRLVDLLEAENVRDRYLLIAGGPFIDNKFAKELGYDAGFGRGSLPSQVATFLAQRLDTAFEKKRSKK